MDKYSILVSRIFANRIQLGLIFVTSLLLLMASPPEMVLAAPVAPDNIELIQPDGTSFIGTPFGDEWYSGVEYDGYTVLLDESTGYWKYARQASDGGLLPSGSKVGIDEAPVGLPTHLRDRVELENAEKLRAESLPFAPELSALAPQAPMAVSGSHPVLIILVNFTPSTSLGTTDAQWSNLFFNNTPGVKSVKNYYEEASYGIFTLDPVAETYGTANDGVVAVTLNYNHPNPYPTNDSNRQIVYDALVAADPYVTFSNYDLDSNGGLSNTELHLMVIVRGFEKSYGGTTNACSPSVWGHRWSLGFGAVMAPTLDGISVADYFYDGGYTQEGEWHGFNTNPCTNSYGHMATMGIMAHELGHDIGWPDLYDTDSSSSGVGYWSVMSSGSWGQASGDASSGETPVLPDAFLKWYQGWLAPTQVTVPTSGVSIPNSAQNATVYQLGDNPGGVDWSFGVSSGTGEYFLVENRQQVGFDAGLWRIDGVGNASGCLIWHIDETRTSDNSANADETRKLVDLEEANGVQDMDAGTNSGDTGDPWPGSSGNTIFNASSVPDSNWYSGTASGIGVYSISSAGTGCTVDFFQRDFTWDGSENSDWDEPNNWVQGSVPGASDNAIIPAGVPNWPTVNVSTDVYDLTIQDGAQINASADFTLNVNGDWVEQGAGNFNATQGTVAFVGTLNQSITAGSSTKFYNFQIGSGSTNQTVTVNSDLDVNGDLAIMSDAILSGGNNTISVAGNWTNGVDGYLSGTSTIIFDGGTQTVDNSAAAASGVAFSEDFVDYSGWTIFDANSDGVVWGIYNTTVAPNSPDTGLHARYVYNTDGTSANDWLYSPGFVLEADVTYEISFNYGAGLSTLPERMSVYIDTSKSTSMANQIFNNNNIINTSWQQGSGTFTPGTSGTYYLGFYAYSAAYMYTLAIDDVSVTYNIDPNLKFYNMQVNSSGSLLVNDTLNVENNLTIGNNGGLDLNSNILTVENTIANNGNLTQTLASVSSYIRFLHVQNAAGTVDKYLGVDITPSGNMGSTTVVIRGNQAQCNVGDELIHRCFDISPGTSQSATIRFWYLNSESGSEVPAAMKAYHWDAPGWSQLDIDGELRGTVGGYEYVEVDNVSAYSPFGLADGDPSDPTAVTVTSLTAEPNGGFIQISWEMGFGVDITGFNVYRSDSIEGSKTFLGYLLAQETVFNYWLVDADVKAGQDYFYWLEVIGLDGESLELFGPVTSRANYAIWIPMVMILP